jgi:hypothetical protein
MFSYNRRLITLAGLATLIAGTAIFSQRLSHLSNADSSADVLLQKTATPRQRHASQSTSLRTANSLPQAPLVLLIRND